MVLMTMILFRSLSFPTLRPWRKQERETSFRSDISALGEIFTPVLREIYAPVLALAGLLRVLCHGLSRIILTPRIGYSGPPPPRVKSMSRETELLLLFLLQLKSMSNALSNGLHTIQGLTRYPMANALSKD